MRLFHVLSLSAFALGLPAAMSAGWLVWTPVSPGVSAEATTPGFTGVATATLSNPVDGGQPGIPGLVPTTLATLTPTFLAGHTPNPGNILSTLNIANNGPDQYDVTVNFSMFGSGLLPAGSLLSFWDMDIREDAQNLIAFDSANSQITTAWLSLLPGTLGSLDVNDSNGDQTGSIVHPTVSGTSVYQVLGPTANFSSGMLVFALTQDVSELRFRYVSQGSGGGGYGLSIQPTPEPSTFALLGLGLVGLGYSARKRRSL